MDRGAGDAQVSSGVLSIGLPATDAVDGRFGYSIAGHRAGRGVSLAASGVDRLAGAALERALGGLPMPVEIELDLADRRVGALLRQPRLVSSGSPICAARCTPTWQYV